MRWGVLKGHAAFEFWKTLNLSGEWIEGELEELVGADVSGIFVSPDQSAAIYAKSRQLSRSVSETRFIDFIEVKNKRFRPIAYFHEHGSEFLTLAQNSLDTHLRAYITGTGPWARLFAVIAVEKGFSNIQIVVPKREDARELIEDLRKFCFGVTIEPILHADLTLQANNGALLVNTILPDELPELTDDLAYLNYLSPKALLIETHETRSTNPLLEEARHSQLALVDGTFTQAFSEYHSLAPAKPAQSWEDYLRLRREWAESRRNSPSVQ